MHPLNNLRVQIFLRRGLGCSEDQVLKWHRHWVAEGFGGIETQLAGTAGECCFGDAITMADLCLVPQVFNARRFACDLSPYPTGEAPQPGHVLRTVPGADPAAVLVEGPVEEVVGGFDCR